MAEAAMALVVLALGVGGGLLLYFAVRAEGQQREAMSRADAERTARRDTSDSMTTANSDERHE